MKNCDIKLVEDHFSFASVVLSSGFSSASQFASALLSLEEDKKNAAPTDPHTRQISIVVVSTLDRSFYPQVHIFVL